MKTIYTRKIKQFLTVAGLSLLLPVTLAAESEKKLYEMTMFEIGKAGRGDEPCVFWLGNARAIYQGVIGDDGPSNESREDSVVMMYPEGSVGYVLEMLAIDASANGKSMEEVGRLVLKECQKYKPRYVVNDSEENGYRDPNPERK